MKKKQFFIIISIVVIIISLLSFLAFSGCKRARIEKLQNLKDSKISSEQTISQAENNESTEETIATESDEPIITTAETESSTSEQNEEESITVETTEAAETTQEEVEEETENNAETIQLIKDLTNLQMEGGTLSENAFTSSGIGVGDYPDNKEVRGFASFDISELSGVNIVKANITATALEKYGEPFKNYGPMIVKAVYWGPYKINPSYFDIDGIELANFSAKNFTIKNAILKDDLQNATNNGLQRYQICLYFEMNQTNGDNIQDCIAYAWDGITLTVTYEVTINTNQ